MQRVVARQAKHRVVSLDKLLKVGVGDILSVGERHIPTGRDRDQLLVRRIQLGIVRGKRAHRIRLLLVLRDRIEAQASSNGPDTVVDVAKRSAPAERRHASRELDGLGRIKQLGKGIFVAQHRHGTLRPGVAAENVAVAQCTASIAGRRPDVGARVEQRRLELVLVQKIKEVRVRPIFAAAQCKAERIRFQARGQVAGEVGMLGGRAFRGRVPAVGVRGNVVSSVIRAKVWVSRKTYAKKYSWASPQHRQAGRALLEFRTTAAERVRRPAGSWRAVQPGERSGRPRVRRYPTLSRRTGHRRR